MHGDLRRVVRVLLLVVMGAAAATTAVAQVPDEATRIQPPDGVPLDLSTTLVLFYSDTCSHCHNQIRWMERIEDSFPDIAFRRFEVDVSGDRDAQAYFAEMMAAYDSHTEGWPRTIIGDRVFIGFAPQDGEAVYNDQYAAWIGFQNQLLQALESLQQPVGRP